MRHVANSQHQNNYDIMEEYFVRLTNSVYKILEFFPESDPLKNRAKDKALSILENPNKEDIDILLGYLWIAKAQGWINSVNFLIVSNGYEKVKEELVDFSVIPAKAGIQTQDVNTNYNLDSRLRGNDKGVGNDILDEQNQPPVVSEAEPKAPPAPVLSDNISDRQKQILEFLDKNKTAQVMDLQTILPNITKRTIRRDLDELLLKDKIVRMGEFNQVVYKIK